MEKEQSNYHVRIAEIMSVSAGTQREGEVDVETSIVQGCGELAVSLISRGRFSFFHFLPGS